MVPQGQRVLSDLWPGGGGVQEDVHESGAEIRRGRMPGGTVDERKVFLNIETFPHLHQRKGGGERRGGIRRISLFHKNIETLQRGQMSR